MQQEFVLQITLGPAMIATKGYGAPEVAAIYARAQELGEHIGETTSEELELLKFPVLFGLWLSHLVRAELDSARELGERCIALARQQQDVALMLEAHRALGATLFYLGELGMAHAYLEEGIAQYQPQHHRSHAFPSLHGGAGNDVSMLCSFNPLVPGLSGTGAAIQRGSSGNLRGIASPFQPGGYTVFRNVSVLSVPS